MPYHYRIINKISGEIRETSDGKREPYATREEALRFGNRSVHMMGYSSVYNRVAVIPAEDIKEQTKS